MAAPKVYFVNLRRPKRSDPYERRDDPFYEFGSFGCTKCHSKNLFNPRHAAELQGARLAFVQGGALGSRLVFLSPPIKVTVWKDCCEAKWSPVEMPFKYADAPLLVNNDGDSDFDLVQEFARDTDCPSFQSGLSSRVRSLTRPLPSNLARQVIAVYERKRARLPRSAIASTYEEALPYAPPSIDHNRKATYEDRIRKLAGDAGTPEHFSRANAKSKLPARITPG